MATYGQLVDGMKQAMKLGHDDLAMAFGQKIQNKEYEEESSGFESAALGLGQGATFGLADEAAAGIRAGLGEFADKNLGSLLYASGVGVDFAEDDDRSFGERFKQYREGAESEQSLGDRYKMALESGRSSLETARREDPWQTGLAEFAGGLSTAGLGGARAAAAAPTLLKSMRNVASTGAGFGALAGYGYGEGDPLAALAIGEEGDPTIGSFGEEALQAGTNVGMGAAMGGLVGGAFPVAGVALRKLGQWTTGLLPGVRAARANETGRREIVERLKEDLRHKYGILDGDEAGMRRALKEAQEEINNTPGMSVADIGLANRELAEEIVQTSTPGGRLLETELTQRNREQWRRIMPRLAQEIGAEDNFAVARRELLAKMKAEAAENYGGIADDLVRVTPEMASVMNNPGFRGRARKLANDLAGIEGLPKLPKDVKAGDFMSAGQLDKMIQGMDGTISAAFRGKGRGAVGTALKPLRDRFRSEVYDAVPDLGKARAAWSGDKAVNDAMDAGLQILTKDADMSAGLIQSMGPSELAGFKIGIIRALARRLGNKSFTSDLTKGIFDSPNKIEALRVAFGGRDKADDFLKFIGREQEMFNTFNQAVHNSRTSKRLTQAAQREGFIGALAKMVGLGGYIGGLSVGGAASPALSGYAARKSFESAARSPAAVRSGQAPQLMTRNLEQLMKPNTLGGLLGTGVPQSAAAGTMGLLGTGALQPQEGAGADVQYGGF